MSSNSNTYKELYYSSSCVPIDFSTIREAMYKCTCQNIILLPGSYEERYRWKISKPITIQAAIPGTVNMVDYCDFLIELKGEDSILTLNDMNIENKQRNGFCWILENNSKIIMNRCSIQSQGRIVEQGGEAEINDCVNKRNRKILRNDMHTGTGIFVFDRNDTRTGAGILFFDYFDYY